jgi:hypothetical protein
MKINRAIVVLVILAFLVTGFTSSVSTASSVLAGNPSVVPGIIRAAVCPHRSYTQQIDVYTDAYPIPKADVVFSFDRTGSM